MYLIRMYILCVMVLLHCLNCGRTSSAVNKMWQEWKIKHSKSYNNQVGMWTFLGILIYLDCTNPLPARHLHSDGDLLPESSVGEEPAVGHPTQPGGLGWETQLHDGTQPSVRPGGNNSQHSVHSQGCKCKFDPFVMSQSTHIPPPSRLASTLPIWLLLMALSFHDKCGS